MGIEPTCPAWKAGALPLSYTRGRLCCESLRNRFLRNRVTFGILGQPFGQRRVLFNSNLVGEGGFEPPKAVPPDLQSGPFGRSGIPPVESSSRHSPERKSLAQRGLNRRSLEASGGTRTHNPRFTKPELCQLSYASGQAGSMGSGGI